MKEAMGFMVILLLSFGGIVFYFLPTVLSYRNKNPKTMAIFILNLLLGWTFLGWAAAMVMAYLDYEKR